MVCWFLISILCLHLFTSNFSVSLLYIAFEEEVNVSCSNGDIRLTDGLTEFEGKVEICYNNHWGGVCGSSWDITEATVVCRQLGHIYYGEMV